MPGRDDTDGASGNAGSLSLSDGSMLSAPTTGEAGYPVNCGIYEMKGLRDCNE
jgi:hypothetical protein